MALSPPLKGQDWDYGLGNMSNLESDARKQILRAFCNIPEPRRGWGPKRCVCVCVCARVRVRMCTRVLLSSALSFLSNLLHPLRQVSVTLEKGHKSFKHSHYRPAPEQPLMIFKALFSHQILRSLFTNCFFYHPHCTVAFLLATWTNSLSFLFTDQKSF